jgi:hypothetical protein
MPTEWQGRWTVATPSVKACYCDDNGTEESGSQIEMIRESGNGTQKDAEGNGCK